MSVNVATLANLRTTAAARNRIHNGAYAAFGAGSVMVIMISSLELLRLSVVYLMLEDVRVLAGFVAGTASVTLICRVVGSIYISATSIGSRFLNLIREGAGVCLEFLETYGSAMAVTATLGSILPISTETILP